MVDENVQEEVIEVVEENTTEVVEEKVGEALVDESKEAFKKKPRAKGRPEVSKSESIPAQKNKKEPVKNVEAKSADSYARFKTKTKKVLRGKPNTEMVL